MVARRIDQTAYRRTPPSVTDPAAETKDAIFINLWLDRQAEIYTDLLMTMAHAPRTVRG